MLEIMAASWLGVGEQGGDLASEWLRDMTRMGQDIGDGMR